MLAYAVTWGVLRLEGGFMLPNIITWRTFKPKECSMLAYIITRTFHYSTCVKPLNRFKLYYIVPIGCIRQSQFLFYKIFQTTKPIITEPKSYKNYL